MKANQFTPVEARFDASYVIEPNSGCWLWTGTAIPTYKGRNYRGVITINTKVTRAYRYAYERFIGPIPEGKIICHKCNVSLCVNPDHLYAGTHRDNALDSVRAGTSPLVTIGAEMRRMATAAMVERGTRRRARPWSSKLAPAQWEEIERRVSEGATLASMESDFGTTRGTMSAMLKRRRARAALALAGGEQ